MTHASDNPVTALALDSVFIGIDTVGVRPVAITAEVARAIAMKLMEAAS